MNGLRWLQTFSVMLLLIVVPAATSFGLTPNDAKVKDLVKQGVKFLNATRTSSRLGEKCLMALALYKAGEPKTNPKIEDAIKAIKDSVPKIMKLKPNQTSGFDHAMTYDVALALVLICELDPDAFAEEIPQLIKYFEKTQKESGGWGYPPQKDSDNSMTQYVVLGFWLADENGYDVPIPVMERACNYIIRVQDPSGGWGYKGKDPGPDAKQRSRQSEIRRSLVAASLSSLHITSDFLNLNSRRIKNNEGETTSVLKEVTSPDLNRRGGGPKTNKVNTQFVRNAKKGGREWLDKNPGFDQPTWGYYYIYSLERYESYRELETGEIGKNAAWYNNGVAHLEKTILKGGTWRGGGESEQVATSFAVLFLVRSTGKSIKKSSKKYDEGLLTGGRGLPKDLADAKIKDGKVVGKVEIVETDEFISLLDKEDEDQLSNMLNAGVSYQLSEDERGRDLQIVILRRKIRNGSFSARMLAIKTIKMANDFDSVPVLVYALTDPDWRVARESRDALRYISRKFSGFGMPNHANTAEKELAAKTWKAWYLSIRPDAIFLD
ncbi:MAG: hypothetical protein ACKVH8_14085 [Pirellulales bacterium]